MRTVKVLIIANQFNVRKCIKYTLNQHPHFHLMDGLINTPDKISQIIDNFHPDVLLYHLDPPAKESIRNLQTFIDKNSTPIIVTLPDLEESYQQINKLLSTGIYKTLTLSKKVIRADSPETSVIRGLAQEVASAAYVRETPARKLISTNKGFNESPLTPTHKKEAVKRTATKCQEPIIAIGASTGGIVIVEKIIKSLPLNAPPVVIAQHIPAGFSQNFAQRMNNKYPQNIYEAVNDQQLESGSIYISPGDWHLKIICRNNHYICRLSQSKRVNSHRPSVEVLFDSITDLDAKDAIGIILTGMGSDGAQGLLRMKQRGLYTIAQDEKSSLIWGMPGEAVKINATSAVLPPDDIASFLIKKFC